MSGARSAGSGPLARIGALVAIVLMFVVLGPPIGAFVFSLLLVGLWHLSVAGARDPGFELIAVPVVVVAKVLLAYLYGAWPAALAGLAIGTKQAFFGRTTWTMALGVGLLAGVVFLEGLDVLHHGPRSPELDGALFLDTPSILILTCVVPTMLCWVLVRSWHFARPSGRVAP